jgi:hypothetical protein
VSRFLAAATVQVEVVPIGRPGLVRYDVEAGGEPLTADEIVRVLRGAADAVERRARGLDPVPAVDPFPVAVPDVPGSTWTCTLDRCGGQAHPWGSWVDAQDAMREHVEQVPHPGAWPVTFRLRFAGGGTPGVHYVEPVLIEGGRA